MAQKGLRNAGEENGKIGIDGFGGITKYCSTMEQLSKSRVAFGKEIKTMKIIKQGTFALSVVVNWLAVRSSLFSKVWIPRIVRGVHAPQRSGTPKTPYKTLGMVHANDSAVMEPRALFNDMGTSAVCLLLILGGLVLGGLSFVQTAGALRIRTCIA